MADGVKVGGVREEEYVSCQPVITLFVPLMDTLYGRSFGPWCTMTRTLVEVFFGSLDRNGHWTLDMVIFYSVRKPHQALASL